MREYEIIVNFAKDKVISKSMVFVQDDNISTQLNFIFEDEIANDQNILLKFKNAKSTVFEDNIIVKGKKATYLVPNTLLGVTGYASMSLTYTIGDSVLTNSAFINDIYVQAKLGEGEQPTQEELALIESVLGQLNSKITETNTATTFANEKGTYANEQGDYAKSVGEQLELDKANGLFKGDKGDKGEQGEQGIQGETGTIIYEQLVDYTEYQARKTAGTLVENVIYYWGEV